MILFWYILKKSFLIFIGCMGCNLIEKWIGLTWSWVREKCLSPLYFWLAGVGPLTRTHNIRWPIWPWARPTTGLTALPNGPRHSMEIHLPWWMWTKFSSVSYSLQQILHPQWNNSKILNRTCDGSCKLKQTVESLLFTKDRDTKFYVYNDYEDIIMMMMIITTIIIMVIVIAITIC